MARTRSIKPGFFRNEKLAELPYQDRLLFAGLWVIADRSGRLEDRPKRIRIDIFPYDHEVDIEASLARLSNSGFINRYSVDGCGYISIPTWDKHQSPHMKEQASTIPAPDMSGASTSLAHPSTLPPFHPSTLPPGNAGPVLPRGYALDELYQKFRETAEPFGWIEGDFLEAWPEWLRLDGEQRIAAVHGLMARIDAGSDLSMVPLPKKYLAKREWNRRPRSGGTNLERLIAEA